MVEVLVSCGAHGLTEANELGELNLGRVLCGLQSSGMPI